MMLLTILLIILGICFIVAFWFFVFPWLVGAPYDVTRKNALKNIVELVEVKSEDKIAELGSGDGRVCIALARENEDVKIAGYEINPFLVLISRRKIKKLGFEKQIKIYWKNFWNVDFGKFNKIVFFQFGSVTGRLEKKFERELKKGAKVISHNWKLPTWKVKKKLGEKGLLEGEVYLYEK